MSLAALRENLRAFAAERDWEQFHSPKNLSMALAGEAGELLELFQWLTQEESRTLANSPEALAPHPDATRLAKGIPKAQLWAHHPGGLDQIGCVYTAQGFEFDYAGVIFGRDLRYDFDRQEWIGDKAESGDPVVKRAKNFTDLIKNTYRVLLSRGMKGCYVFFEDKDTERFWRSRMEVERAEMVAESKAEYEVEQATDFSEGNSS